MDEWTFGRRIAAGFALSFLLLVAIGSIAYRSIDTLTRTSGLVAHTYLVLDGITNLVSVVKDAETAQRGYVITGDEAFLEPYQGSDAAAATALRELRSLTADNPSQQARIDQVEPVVQAKFNELQRVIDIRRSGDFDGAIAAVKAGQGKRDMDRIRSIAADMEQTEHGLLATRATEADVAASSGRMTIVVGTLLCLALVIATGFWLTAALTKQIGTAVRHIESSSNELKAVSHQQASGAKEQSTAMNEITTTINELLATSRQIAERAQHVSQVAGQTEGSARRGDETVDRANESFSAIRRHTDQIVTHMVELGRKGQQIGAVVDIVSELAEQTNILAINATIEAAGAGEVGRRFGVVADEIRKLADRVSGSAKEIRALVDDVRGAVNASILSTETGSKAVDAGARQFVEVASAFRQIGGLVLTTGEAAKEIELSTKQQATAVEQVNLAVSNVAQATRESEASTHQTLQTASQLAGLSRELIRIVTPDAAHAG